MSDLSISFENLDSSQKQKKSEIKRDSFFKVIKIIFSVLTVCVLLEFCFYKFFVPCMRSPIVQVQGGNTFTPEEIVDFLRPMNSTNWFDFDVEQAVSILASQSAIDSVTVKKSFPNKIYINVIEREPVAITFLSFDKKSIPVQIDRSGVIFPEKKNVDNADIPIISGLPIDHLTEGMRVPVKYRALIEQIANIRDLPQKYFTAISEICVVPKEYGNYELVLIPIKSKIRVLTDRTLNEDSLKYMMVVLDVVDSINDEVSEIDLRYGSVSYRKMR